MAEISKITASSHHLHRQMPINYLQTIAESLDNQDIPPEIFTQLYSDLNEIIKGELPLQSPKEKRMQSTLYSLVRQESPFENPSFYQTVDLFRQKLVMGTLLSIKNCPGAMGLQKMTDFGPDIDGVIAMFRRIPNQQMILAEFSGRLILATGSLNDDHGELYFPFEWKKGIRYALGTNTGAAGQYFSVQHLQQETNLDSKASIVIIQELLNACVLEATLTKMDTTSSEIIEEGNSESIITPQPL